MNIAISAENLQVCMRLWRESLDMSIPMAPEFRLHFIQDRPTILRNYQQASTAWLMLLRGAEPVLDDRDEFAQLIENIEAFQAWAKDEILAYEKLALQTALEAGIDDLLLFGQGKPPSAKA